MLEESKVNLLDLSFSKFFKSLVLENRRGNAVGDWLGNLGETLHAQSPRHFMRSRTVQVNDTGTHSAGSDTGTVVELHPAGFALGRQVLLNLVHFL